MRPGYKEEIMKKIISAIIAVCILLSVVCVATVGSNAATPQYANGTVEGGNILHAMCWSYNTIKDNLDAIKAAGYSAVQTSCIQPPKDYFSSSTTKKDIYWHFYQPIDICVANGNNWLGTKAELTALCSAAHEKGISIISDIVVNHMASPGSNGSYNSTNRSKDINQDLLTDESCWHNQNKPLDNSRYGMVLYDNNNQPDLNTSSTKVQNYVISLLKEAVDCGVDGFRFDGAQNIETPLDDSGYNSYFWPNVMNAVNSYTNRTLFSYGEVYGTAFNDAALNDYVNYIGHVSDPGSGVNALWGVEGSNAANVANYSYENGKEAKNNVIWVESHDTYYGNYSTNGVYDHNIIRAWAIVGSRAGSTGLFFVRPGSEAVATAASTNTTWQSTAVAEVNKFKNYFRGQSEYLSSSGNVAYNERGSGGVVISKLDGAGSVSIARHMMNDGTYTDQISGNTFTVSNGVISGDVGDSGVAVVYNPSNTSMTEPTYASSGKTLTLKPGVWNTDDAWFAAYFYGSNGEAWMKMSGSGSTYTVDAPAGFTNVIFARMNSANTYSLDWNNKWNQTGDLTIPASNATYTITDWGSETSPGSWTVDPTTAPTTAPASAPSGTYLVGDADGSGEITVLDVTTIQRKLAEYSCKSYDADAADANQNGEVEITDATAIQRRLADYSDNYHIGEQVSRG